MRRVGIVSDSSKLQPTQAAVLLVHHQQPRPRDRVPVAGPPGAFQSGPGMEQSCRERVYCLLGHLELSPIFWPLRVNIWVDLWLNSNGSI